MGKPLNKLKLIFWILLTALMGCVNPQNAGDQLEESEKTAIILELLEPIYFSDETLDWINKNNPPTCVLNDLSRVSAMNYMIESLQKARLSQ